jgi:hypothetical protein
MSTQQRRSTPAEKKQAYAVLRGFCPERTGYIYMERVLWPYMTLGVQPNLTTPFASVDSRGFRNSRRGDEIAASDDVPENAGFIFGGSVVFGFGATGDSTTISSALWKHSGRPYINLGVPAGSSTQELIAALPFAERKTRFIVLSGANEVSSAIGAPIDPLFGPNYFDVFLKKLQTVTIEELVHLVWAARKGRGPRLRRRSYPKGPNPPQGPSDSKTILANAAALQLRNLRALRRLVPDEAEVVFAFQPSPRQVAKERTEEEVAIYEALDIIQDRGGWHYIKQLLEKGWRRYGAALAEGCAELGVPFIDLNDAPYTGWCFIDRIHMNDRGNDLTAQFLLEGMAAHGLD